MAAESPIIPKVCRATARLAGHCQQERDRELLRSGKTSSLFLAFLALCGGGDLTDLLFCLIRSWWGFKKNRKQEIQAINVPVEDIDRTARTAAIVNGTLEIIHEGVVVCFLYSRGVYPCEVMGGIRGEGGTDPLDFQVRTPPSRPPCCGPNVGVRAAPGTLRPLPLTGVQP